LVRPHSANNDQNGIPKSRIDDEFSFNSHQGGSSPMLWVVSKEDSGKIVASIPAGAHDCGDEPEGWAANVRQIPTRG